MSHLVLFILILVAVITPLIIVRRHVNKGIEMLRKKKESLRSLKKNEQTVVVNETEETIDNQIQNKENHSSWLLWFIVIVGGVIVVVFGLWLTDIVAQRGIVSSSAKNLGESFGGVETLISAMAFAGVIVSIYLQREELRLQRKELEAQRRQLELQNENLVLQRKDFEQQNETLELQRKEFEQQNVNLDLQRKELERQNTNLELQRQELEQQNRNLNLQRQEFKLQNFNLKLQRFENTLFSMLSILQQIINDVKITDSNGNIVATGMASFEYSFEKEDGGLRRFLTTFGFKPMLYVEQKQVSHYHHFFRYLYSILLYIDKTSEALIKKEDKYISANYLKSMMSNHALMMLFYYGLSFRGEQIKPLIQKYSFLEYLDKYNMPLSYGNEKRENGYMCKTDYDYYITDFSEEQNNPKLYHKTAFYPAKFYEDNISIVKKEENQILPKQQSESFSQTNTNITLDELELTSVRDLLKKAIVNTRDLFSNVESIDVNNLLIDEYLKNTTYLKNEIEPNTMKGEPDPNRKNNRHPLVRQAKKIKNIKLPKRKKLFKKR